MRTVRSVTLPLFSFSQLSKSKSDGEVGQTASSGCGAPDKNGKVGTLVLHKQILALRKIRSSMYDHFLCDVQGLQLVLRDLSNPSDMDPRRQLGLQGKGILSLWWVSSGMP